MLLSIIVPTYNVEKYISQCINSLLKIKLDDMEIIIVNDGSNDNTLKVVNKFKDRRIVVINKENGGLSSARNTGIINAKGEFILFVDSDDFICNTEYIIRMIDIANKENVDIVIGNGWNYYDDNIKKEFFRSDEIFNKLVYNSTDLYANLLSKKSYYDMVWLNLYKKDFILNNHLFFKEGIYHEDVEWMPRTLLKSKKVAITKYNFYMYRQRNGSISNLDNKRKNAIDIINTIEGLENIFKMIYDENLRTLLNDWQVNMYIGAFLLGRKYDKNFKDYINIKFLEGKAHSFKSKMKVMLIKLNCDLTYYINCILKSI